MTKVTVLIPAYNEEATIGRLLEAVNEQIVEGIEFEVVVVDDGSTDGTVDLLRENPHLYAKLIEQPRNQGKGAAVKAGLKEASGDYVLFQDADLEYDPADYAKLLLPVTRYSADVVMGSRLVAPQFTRVYYFWHKVGNRFITLLFNILYNMTFTDIYSCYLVYRRDLFDAEGLRSTGWAQHAEILAKAVKNAKVIYEVPVSYHGRSYEEGKKIKAYHVLAVIGMIFRQRFLG